MVDQSHDHGLDRKSVTWLGLKPLGRGGLAAATWYCEAATVGLTFLFCAVVGHDMGVSANSRISSASWYQHGFCESWQDHWLNSHSLCFVSDVIVGSMLACANCIQWSRNPKKSLKLGAAASFLTVMHGFGHAWINMQGGLDEKLVESMRPAVAPIAVSLCCFLALASFLAVGPYIGYIQGVPWPLCVAIHIPTVWCFLQHMRVQLAFGTVQLLVNLWFCLPRLFFVGPEQISQRVDDGWLAASVAVLLLMPVAFMEMLGCDSFFHLGGGHFLYDFSAQVLVAAHSVSSWQ